MVWILWFGLTVYGLRFEAYDLRCTVYGLRFTVYGRVLPNARMRQRETVCVSSGIPAYITP